MPRSRTAPRLVLSGSLFWLALAIGQAGSVSPDAIADMETDLMCADLVDTTGDAAFVAGKGHYRHPVDDSQIVKPKEQVSFDLSDPNRSVIYSCSEACDVMLVAEGVLLKEVTLSPFSVGYVFGHGSYRTVYSGLTTRNNKRKGEPCTAGLLLGRAVEQEIVFQVYRVLPSGEIEELDARDWLE